MSREKLSRLGFRLRVMIADPVKGFQISLLLVVILIVIGTIGYLLLERMSVVDAFYMTIITITTVGFGEVHTLSAVGRIFTSLLIFLGVGIVTIAISNVAGVILGPHLWLAIRERRMEETIKLISDHYIVCGYGRMGQQIARDLQARKQAFVVIERSPEMRQLLLEDNLPHIIGDGTLESTLEKAGIERAQGLVCALNSDSDNVMTVLTARELNPSLFIVARAVTPSTETKLRRAGADRVVSPYNIGGHRMALALLRPAIHDFMNYLFHIGDDLNMDIGQISIKSGSPLVGQSIAQLDLRRKRNVNILAVQKPTSEFAINPNAQYVIEPGDVLIVIGPTDTVYRIEDELDEAE
ncbi:MAG: potassium channel protein [Anaerolineae bacterium]